MTENDNVQEQLDALMNLVSSRSQGTGNDELIEQAVTSLLSNIPQPAATKSTSMAGVVAANGSSSDIIVDQDNYDDDDDDDDDDENQDSKKLSPKTNITSKDSSNGEPIWTGEKATIQSLEKQEQELKKKNESQNWNISDLWKNLDDIPLGRTGAKIMITFGDGPVPDPLACATALLATRHCLQTAIKDARALRRKMKNEFEKARAVLNMHKADKKQRSILGPDVKGAKGIDMDLYFKAIAGHDKRLTYNNPSGFDETQVEKLFPEEMSMYKRWNAVWKEYNESKNNDANGTKNEKEEGKEELNSAAALEDEIGGYVHERLAQFDIRTERMKQQWYIKFSEVRKGSFLDRGGMTSEARVWESERKQRGNGRKKSSTWEALPASHIQFLHWLGFEQRSPLPPPDASTTEALAFLGYDFMGKIIEKAIFFKFLKDRQRTRERGIKEGEEIVLEMGSGGQLMQEDIENALSDSTVLPKSLYNASNSPLDTIDAAQIYCGPGFEERIEMEMEQ